MWGSGSRAGTESLCQRSNPGSLLIRWVALGGHLPSLSFSFLPCRSGLSSPVGVAMNGPSSAGRKPLTLFDEEGFPPRMGKARPTSQGWRSGDCKRGCTCRVPLWCSVTHNYLKLSNFYSEHGLWLGRWPPAVLRITDKAAMNIFWAPLPLIYIY